MALPLVVHAEIGLTSASQIRIITCGPYQGELYSAFGHSAIRVTDSAQGIDAIFNYGVFNFNQPHFYLNFARGYLNYRLAVEPYDLFLQQYIDENRFVHEQILNLDLGERQQLFNFLQWNARPENMHYNYDYFYDNCAIRIRDALKRNFGDRLQFDGSYIQNHKTIRQLCDSYLQQQPWGALGIDICLGLPMDTTANSYMYMFLPDYIEQGFNHATIISNGGIKPLVKQTIITNKEIPQPAETELFTPFVVTVLLLLFGLWLTYRGYKHGKSHRWFDIIIFSITGLLGWLLFLLWIATDHHAAAQNFNLLWAIPFHFPVALFLIRKKKTAFIRWYFGITGIICLILLVTWAFLPQHLHYALAPWVILLLVRARFISQRTGSLKTSRSDN